MRGTLLSFACRDWGALDCDLAEIRSEFSGDTKSETLSAAVIFFLCVGEKNITCICDCC